MEITEDLIYQTFPDMDKTKQYFGSYDEFNIFMCEIDNGLKDKPISGRELLGTGEVAKKLNITIPYVPKTFAKEDDFSILSLSAHIGIWFDKQYGKRLCVNFSSVHTICFVAKDIYKVNIPLVFQDPKLYFTGKTESHNDFINLGSLIENINDDKLQRITKEEIQYLAERVTYGCLLGNKIFCLGRNNFSDALGDFDVSIDMLFCDKPLYGQSMWHCLQFVEKMMKIYLENSDIKYPFSHDLKKLSELIPDISLDNSDLENIQCSASSRYDSSLYSEVNCIKGHESAQKIVLQLLDKLKIGKKS